MLIALTLRRDVRSLANNAVNRADWRGTMGIPLVTQKVLIEGVFFGGGLGTTLPQRNVRGYAYVVGKKLRSFARAWNLLGLGFQYGICWFFAGLMCRSTTQDIFNGCAWGVSHPFPAYRRAWTILRGTVAQRLEQGTHNPLVGGSNPSGPILVH